VDWEEKNSEEMEETAEAPETEEELEEGLSPEDEIETAAQREAREKREEEERQAKARKRRLIPPFVMLFAGAVVSITMRILHYDLQTMLIVLLCVLLGFYFVGRILQIMLDRFEQQIQEAHMEEGEVIEKEPSE
jgi:Flp pilus assembly protein TadB